MKKSIQKGVSLYCWSGDGVKIAHANRPASGGLYEVSVRCDCNILQGRIPVVDNLKTKNE